MNKILTHWCLIALFCWVSVRAWAGGSGLNVVIVVNQNSTNSIQLGNYYQQMRHVPPQNFLRINWTGTNTVWAISDFTNVLYNPLLAMLASRQLTNQIDYVVLSMDIPYRIDGGTNHFNSTTAALFYGFKNDPDWSGSTCNLANNSLNLYSGSEAIFRSTPPSVGVVPGSNSFLTTMITGNTLSNAELVVRQGATSDATFPSQTTWLVKSSQWSYNVRYAEFNNAIYSIRLLTNYSVTTGNFDYPIFPNTILGYQNGSYSYFTSPTPLFVPGAIADNLCSYGGMLFEDTSGETTLLQFLAAGASGSYGTVMEPCNYLVKFPDPQDYFYQARGFSLAECYYQSLDNPYQGLVAGEPLAAPFAQPGTGAWIGLNSNSVISGTTNLSVQFTASDSSHLLQQVDLFLDGNFLQTVTSVTPQASNVLNISLNGFSTSYTVPTNSTIKSVTSGLVSTINTTSYQNNTKVMAYSDGDRVELRSTAGYTKMGAQIPVLVGSSTPTGTLNTYVRSSVMSQTNFLDTVATGINTYQITGSLVTNAHLTCTVTKTNGAVVAVVITNSSGTTSFATFAQQLVTAISNTTALQGTDGIAGGDLEDGGTFAVFNLHALSTGYPAAQIKAVISGTGGINVSSGGIYTMTANVSDLQPRNHLYVTSGATNLPVNIPFNTTNFADGYHELVAVAYEGSSVHTQTRGTQNVVIKNGSLTATLTPAIVGSTNTPQAALQFSVVANQPSISSIQLFSTGGLLSSATGQPSANFTVDLNYLNIGIHPFYAVVTDTSGHQYRTQTISVGLTGVNNSGTNLIGINYPFPIQVTSNPLTLTWPATAGRNYNVLSTTNLLTTPFTVYATVIPTSSIAQWTETNASPAAQFYRISVSP